ncbi:hypothetical protein Tco_0554750 [Tanacetum coccineum]
MELKYHNQALKDGQHGQILNETSNKAKFKKEIEVLETINVELEHSVAKLLAENEKLHKENEHLKQTYKDLYDSIKKTRVQTKDHNDSLIAQINSKTVENADLKAQIQEKVKMDDPNITMEEYIRLKEEKARRRGKVYNWETATYGKIGYDEDVNDLISVETKFPAIMFNDTLMSEPTVSYLNNEIDFRVSFDDSDDEDYTEPYGIS